MAQLPRWWEGGTADPIGDGIDRPIGSPQEGNWWEGQVDASSNASTFYPYNAGAFEELEPEAKQVGIEAYLIEYDQSLQSENRLWTFLFNPQSLEFSRQAQWSETSTFAAAKQDLHYYLTKGKTLSIPEIILDTFLIGQTFQPLLDGLEALMEARPAANQFSPPILSFVWGDRRFAPCVLTDCSWRESAWLNGRPAKAILNITLAELPVPELRSDARAPEIEAETDPNKLPTPLTDRQREDASKEAKKWLEANKAKLSDELAKLVESNAYLLSTNAETGAVTMFGSDKKELGIVGKWDGKTFVTEAVQTIPLKKKEEEKP